MAPKSQVSKGRLPTSAFHNDGDNGDDFDEGSFDGRKIFQKKNRSQVQLTEEQLKEQFTKILYPNNPRAVVNNAEFNFKEGAFKVNENVSQLAIHFCSDGHLVRTDSAEFRQLAELKEMLEQNAAARSASEKVHVKIEDESRVGKGASDKPLRSQFNFADRGCQSENPILKHRGISTVPPPTTRFADTVTQWMIYDRYMADIKAENEDGKEHGTHTRRHRADDEEGSGANVLALAAASGAAEFSALLRDKERRRGDALMYSPELRDATKIMFRLVSQNTEADVYHDFKYYDDPADKYRDRTSGQLLPLWRFHCEKVKKKHVTAIKWNPKHTDMFAVGYGSYSFGKHAPSGAICVFSLKNSRFPEFVFTLESGVCSLDWHPTYPWLLVCGLYDGSVAVYDVRVQQSKNKVNAISDNSSSEQSGEGGAAASNPGLLTGALANPPPKAAIKRNAPLFISQVRDKKHTDPVWDVKWNPDATAGSSGFNFFSVSSDGRVSSWTRLNDRLEAENICFLKLISGVKQAAAAEASAIASSQNISSASPAATSVAVAALDEEEEENGSGLSALAGGLCFALHPKDSSIFLVGTEEGCIHKCSRAYSGEYLFTYVGHSMAVYSVEWNKYHKNIFLSCSADWTVRMWDDRKTTALLTFDLEQSVGDIAWAPYNATTFAAVTASNDPVVRVYDLRVDKHSQICEQKVIKKGPLTRVAFSDASNVLLVGDQRGGVSCLKLSPNLRSEVTVEPKEGDKKKRKLELALLAANNNNLDVLKIQKLEYVLDDLNEKPVPFDEEGEADKDDEDENSDDEEHENN